ncbi:signal peptidase I [Candidatus Campbellbacteria bacterium CG10_big_fil_rev_8_21_14_0_10_35_52]|uniref:Signal peptidase I n=1 Tax=Candidatus Campbellbacteria bacterium CG10_big_fil_rev_8_21_14_0_10_35_52 TaxID=1974527 RepID=A0A2M6WVA2_9BACT|nr:MAG: signal peptidase I [Candidatus Campbellbacteria bacterium CG10_big_fil_rev_8_21_14_0_10_35_52]
MEPKKENLLKEVLKFSLVAILIVAPIRIYIAQPFIVSGSSMEPTFQTKQYLIVDQISYRFEKPKRGEVVIFKYPNNRSIFFIKRIIGLPGETIEMIDGKVFIKNNALPEGFIVKEPYINEKTDDLFTIVLGSDEYFVMGDNRMHSSDSRVWGPLDEKFIVGKAFLRLFPLNKIGIKPGHID